MLASRGTFLRVEMSTEVSNRMLADLICQAAEIHRAARPEQQGAVSRVVFEVGRMAERLAPDREADADRSAPS
jgi:hypothetical protein